MIFSIMESFDVLWKDISQGVREIHLSKALTNERFIVLYSKVYNFCTCRTLEKSGLEKLGSATENRGKTRLKSLSDQSNNGVGTPILGQAGFIGRKLYDNLESLLQEILEEKVKDLTEKSGFDLIKSYNTEWQHFTLNAKAVNKVFSYLNRHWIHHAPGPHKLASKGLQIYQLGIDTWKTTVFDRLKAKLIPEITKNYTKDRTEGTIDDKTALKNVIFSFLTMGLTNESDPNSGTQNENNGTLADSDTGLKLNPVYYIEDLQGILVSETEIYFIQLANDYISSHPSFTDYIKMVETEICKEEERVRFYLPTISFQPILNVCNEILIRNHLEQLQTEFSIYLSKEKLGDLGRTYSLVNRLENEMLAFHKLFTEHVSGQGRIAISTLLEQQSNSQSTDPTTFVEAILEVYQKYKKMIVEIFKNNTGFNRALDMACDSFVNTNVFTSSPNTSQKSAELLARHCDSVLRKSNRSYDSSDDKVLDDIMQVFTYVADKDAFQTYYTYRLANRLVNFASNDDNEQSIITKMKLQCGFEYSSKWTRMYQDMAISKDLHNEFKLHLVMSKIYIGHDFQPLILTSGSWPFKQPSTTFSIPTELESPILNFIQFYHDQHIGRKLVWLFSRSKGEMKTNCFSTPHIFQLSVFQMAVLLMYNNAVQYRFDEILETTKLSRETAEQVLHTLTTSNILISDTMNPSAETNNELTDATTFKLNLDYKNRKHRVGLPSTNTVEQKMEKVKNEDLILKGRSLITQACIVRIMKMRQTLKHVELVMEVMAQTNKQFRADPALIKTCIELLITKEYMQRSEEEHDKYFYIA